MITCVRYTPAIASEWDNFVQLSRTPLFMFKRSFIEYHSNRFEDYSLVFRDKSEIIALLPANKVNDELFSHGGLTYGGLIFAKKFSAEKMLQIFDVMINTIREWGFQSLIYKSVPYIFEEVPCGEAKYALTRNGATLVRRDLSSVVKLSDRPAFSTLRKRKIKLGRRSDLEIASTLDFTKFHEILSVSLLKHGTQPVHSIKELEYIKSKFPSNIELIVAKKAGIIQAGILLFVFNTVVHTQYIAVSSGGKDYGALDLLISEAIDKFETLKYDYFSFGISTEKDGKYLNNGLIHQKEGFGGKGVVIDTYRLDFGND